MSLTHDAFGMVRKPRESSRFDVHPTITSHDDGDRCIRCGFWVELEWLWQTIPEPICVDCEKGEAPEPEPWEQCPLCGSPVDVGLCPAHERQVRKEIEVHGR